MRSKLLLCLALVFGGGLVGYSQTNGIELPVIPAPAMHQCREAKVKDLGLWDDAFRFEDSDFVLLRKQDALFSYSPVTGGLRKIRTLPDLVDSRLVEGIIWQKRQWVFCQSQTSLPFAVDLTTGKTVTFEIPGVKTPGADGSAIHAVINVGFGPGTIIAITGDGAAGWPRDGNRPLYYWMDLNSGKVVKFPTGWDLSYFSADQRRAVFEGVSANAWMYRLWVTVNMATGTITDELPDQTKVLWSEPTMSFWQDLGSEDARYNNRRDVWQLRTPRTPMKLLHPQPGRGSIDDKFAGLSVNGAEFTLGPTDTNINNRCVDAKSAGSLAACSLQPDGASVENSFWVTRLGKNEKPILVANNCRDFEMLGDQRCALLVRNHFPAAAPEALVYEVKSNAAWNVLDGVPLQSEIAARVGATNRLGMAPGMLASGIGPMVAFRLIPGFGSVRFPSEVLCLCSTEHIVPDYAIPPPVQRMMVLLTAQGRRYEINLPRDMRDWSLTDSWLHNSGRLIICQYEKTPSTRRQLHLYVADLRTEEK